MAGSDVVPVIISDEVALDADGISTAAAVGNNAALTIGGALASGGSVTNASGRQVTILSAGNDSSKSFTVVGTDVNGSALTESVTGANAGTATSSGYFKTITSITAVGNPAGNVSAGINNNALGVIFAGRCRLKGFSFVSGGTAGKANIRNTGANAGTATSSGYFKTITSITAVGNPAGNVSAGINNNALGVVFAGRCRLQGFSTVSGGTAGTINIRNESATGTEIIQSRTIGTDSTSEDPFVPDNGVLFTDGCFVTFVVGTVDLMMFYHA